MKVPIYGVVCLSLAFSSTIISAQPRAKRPIATDTLFNQRLLSTLPEGYERVRWQKVAVGKGGKKTAYFSQRGAKQFAVINGVKQPEFDQVQGLTVNPDGSKVAYVATVNKGLYPGSSYFSKYENFQNKKQSFVIINGLKGTAFPYIEYTSIAFSPDGKRVIYTVSDLLAKDKAVRHLESDSEVSLNGKAYLLASYLVINGKKTGDGFRGISAKPTFSADGQHLAFSSWGNMTGVDCLGDCVVVDGRVTGVRNLTDKYYISFTPDGSRLAYSTIKCIDSDCKNSTHEIVVGEKRESVKEKGIAQNNIGVSPDGKTIVYKVTSNNKSKIVVNGKKQAEYSHTFGSTPYNDFLFTPNGKLTYQTAQGDQIIVVRDNQVLARFDSDWIGDLTYDQKGNNLAFVNFDKRTSGIRPKVSVGVIDAAGIVHSAEKVDEILTPLYFDNTGKKVAYGARIDRQLWWKVMEVGD